MQNRLPLLSLCVLILATFPVSQSRAENIQLPDDVSISPDGKQVSFSYAGDIWLGETAGGIARRLTIHPARDGEPFFSPDGKRLAFTSNRTGSNQIFTMTLDSQIPKQVTFHTEGFSNQGWYPNADELLTLGSRDHYWRDAKRMIRISTTERKAERVLLDAACEYARLSPDGKKVLFVREGEKWWRKGYIGPQAAQIWLYDSESNAVTKLLDNPRGCRSPIWKPDDTGFYYVGAESGSFNLREYSFESKTTRALTSYDDDSVVMPAVSSDGNTIIFRRLFDLYRFNLKSKKLPEKITFHTAGDVTTESMLRRTLSTASYATFTDDGLEIAFVAGGDLWVMDTELKEPVSVTTTACEEKEPIFSKDGKAVYFLRDSDGQIDLFKVERKDPKRYWWQNAEFVETQITDDPISEYNIQISPDGKRIAVVRGEGNLWVMDVDGTNGKQLTSGFSAPQYDFSPDGTWLAYSQNNDNFNSEVWIVPTDGSLPATNVSRHPDNDRSPVWSPDGKILAFVGRRNADETDIYYVFLKREDEERTSRDITLTKALDKMKKARPSSSTSKPDSTPATKKTETNKPDAKRMAIDLEGIHDRLHRISVPNSEERSLFWFADGKTLGFSTSINGQAGTYTVQIPTRLKPAKISSSSGTFVKRLKDKKRIARIVSGKLGTLTSTGSSETFSFSVRQELSQRERYQAGFDAAWRLMRDNWYDENLNNRNWDAIRRKYTDAAGSAPDLFALKSIVEMMLGELNGSHLGFYPKLSSPKPPGWQPVTPHLGLRFESNFNGPGLKIRDVVLNGPSDKENVKIQSGEILTSIDGRRVDPEIDLTLLLNGTLSRDIKLGIRDSKGHERTAIIRPTTYSTVRDLLYTQWVEHNEKMVAKLSEEKLGYLHIKLMNDSSFREFERQLYNVGYGKDGLVIDVRDNGGGFTTDHLLTALTQPSHAVTVPRGGGPGYPQDRMIYATWNKPVVVLCNQNSYSNAEIFSHAIKNLKRGKLVGVTTAGGVISTGGASVMDLGFLRQPFRGWYIKRTGEDMELNGAVPHHELWPMPGEIPQGKDRQIEKAVQVLSKDVKKWNKRPRPELKPVSETRK